MMLFWILLFGFNALCKSFLLPPLGSGPISTNTVNTSSLRPADLILPLRDPSAHWPDVPFSYYLTALISIRVTKMGPVVNAPNQRQLRSLLLGDIHRIYLDVTFGGRSTDYVSGTVARSHGRTSVLLAIEPGMTLSRREVGTVIDQTWNLMSNRDPSAIEASVLSRGVQVTANYTMTFDLP